MTLAEALLKYYGTPEMKQRAKEPGAMEKLEKVVAELMKQQTIILKPTEEEQQ